MKLLITIILSTSLVLSKDLYISDCNVMFSNYPKIYRQSKSYNGWKRVFKSYPKAYRYGLDLRLLIDRENAKVMLKCLDVYRRDSKDYTLGSYKEKKK